MSSPSLTGPELLPKSGSVKHVVILLHGVGSNGDDLVSLAPMIAPALPDTAFLGPNGAFAFDQAPFGYQWFSLRDRSLAAMRQGVNLPKPYLDAYIDAAKARFGVEDKDIILMGFSQGTMTALFVGLQRETPLAGIVGFCGALIGGDAITQTHTPVFLSHGEQDEVVPFAAMAVAKKELQEKGIAVETVARPYLGHSVDNEGLEAAVAFMRRQFKL